MEDDGYYHLTIFDGVCDSTKEIDTLTGEMNTEDKWVLSSSGQHMYIKFDMGILSSYGGFSANIHYGIKFKKFLLTFDMLLPQTF